MGLYFYFILHVNWKPTAQYDHPYSHLAIIHWSSYITIWLQANILLGRPTVQHSDEAIFRLSAYCLCDLQSFTCLFTHRQSIRTKMYNKKHILFKYFKSPMQEKSDDQKKNNILENRYRVRKKGGRRQVLLSCTYTPDWHTAFYKLIYVYLTSSPSINTLHITMQNPKYSHAYNTRNKMPE